ncbi:MAG: ribonuclease D [Thermoanaerobaculia bacterium]
MIVWIDRQDRFDEAMQRIGAQPMIAVDTEADSLHSYFDKVCLIQISIPGDDFVIDPLSGINLAAFGRVLADPNITKILHGGDYDLRILHRDFGYTVSNLIDTMISAQLLGYEAFGLAALLDRHFSVKSDKVHQRADWAMRPLPRDMLDYAALDTRHLIALAATLREELTALGRWDWALEEFSRLESVRYRENDEEVETWRKVKNIGNLDRRSLAIFRDLYKWRDTLARAADRPPFKIIGNDVLIEIARAKPAELAELARIKGMSRYHMDRSGRDVAAIVRRALELPEVELPPRNEPKPWLRDRALENSIEKMKKTRDRIAGELKIEPSVLAPRHVLTAIATGGSLDVPAMRQWQKTLLGDALLSSLGERHGARGTGSE